MTNDATRHSRAVDAEIISDPLLVAQREALNGLKQFQAAIEMVDTFLARGDEFRFRPSHLLHLHRLALDGLSGYAGNWRPTEIVIGGSKHKPPAAYLVPELIEELCDYVNSRWSSKSPMHLAAYVMWRLNWIHPFTDGNGRTSRAAAYVVLCTRLGYVLPGRNTIPEQIAGNKAPYYKALENADEAWARGDINLTDMKSLLQEMLAKQLLTVHEDSKSGEE